MTRDVKVSVSIVDMARKKVGEVELSPFLFSELEDHGEVDLVLRTLEAQAKKKCGYTKGRSEISGSNVKMYRQKGTGRARHSTSKAPQFVGGGICHGPKGMNRHVKTNRRVWRKAMQLLLMKRIKAGKVFVFDNIVLDERKTKKALALFPEIGKEKVVFVDQNNVNLRLSVRNVVQASVKDPVSVTVEDLVQRECLFFSREGFDVFLRRIQKTVSRGTR